MREREQQMLQQSLQDLMSAFAAVTSQTETATQAPLMVVQPDVHSEVFRMPGEEWTKAEIKAVFEETWTEARVIQVKWHYHCPEHTTFEVVYQLATGEGSSR